MMLSHCSLQAQPTNNSYMKTLFSSKPILSFILLTFLITFTFWLLPVFIALPKDLSLGTIIIGGCGPLIAGYIISSVNSGEKFKIKSKPIFFIVFISAFIVLLLRLYFVNNGLSDVNGKIPALNEVSYFGYIIFAIAFFILGINLSNATNIKLKENYLKSFLFESPKLKWYIIGFLLLIVLNLSSYLIGSLLKIETSDFIIKPEPIWLISFFSTFLFFGGNEEFGWRGFLQKEMQKKYSPLISVLIISFLWSLWHLPLHYNGFYSTGGFVDLLPRFIWTIPITIIFTWLYNKSSYSILAVVLLHAVLNNVGKVIGSSEMVFTVFGIIFCIYCIIDDKMWKKKPYHLVYQKEVVEKASS